MPRKTTITLGIAAWAVAVGLGWALLVDYGTRPSQQAQPPLHWPVASISYQHKTLPTLLLFAHLHCPCTRATIAELARLIAHHRGQANVHVLFYHPLEKPREWVEAELWQQAQTLPDVSVSTVSALDLLRFGVATSGQTLLYDATGELVFSGGITGSRGHQGDNTGRSAIETYLENGQISTPQTPVFGCSITTTGG